MRKHIDEAVGTVIGTVLGFIGKPEFADELQTIKLAALGAITGFAVTALCKALLQWVKSNIKR
jgi:hypothetical protein